MDSKKLLIQSCAKAEAVKKLPGIKNLKNSFHCFDNEAFADENGLDESLNSKESVSNGAGKLPDVEVVEQVRRDDTKQLNDVIKNNFVIEEDEIERLLLNELSASVADEEKSEKKGKMVKETLKMFSPRMEIKKPDEAERVEREPDESTALKKEEPEIESDNEDDEVDVALLDEEIRRIEQGDLDVDDKKVRSETPSGEVEVNDVEEEEQTLENIENESNAIENQRLEREADGTIIIRQRMSQLVTAFSDRANKIKNRIVQPITPPSSPSIKSEHGAHENEKKEPEDAAKRDAVEEKPLKKKRFTCPSFPDTFEPQSKVYVAWLLVVTIAYLYNAWVIFLRAAFYYQTEKTLPYFLAADYFSDFIYLIDILVFKVRVRFINSGFWVENRQEIKAHYIKKFKFKMDLLSLLPLDLFYFYTGVQPLFRIPRLLKIQTFWEFFNRVDSIAKAPYVIRILRTVLYMLYLIHLNTCVYFSFSDWEGIGSNQWVFSGQGNAYVRCFYFATKTATSIGKNPKPVNENEYLYMTFSWLMGVFIFALLIGQVRDIVATANQAHKDYQETVDKTILYMQRLNIPDELQAKVRLWFDHNWEQQKMLDERETLEVLPLKMKTDMALSVNFNTLNKVQLFKDCEKALLRDLVLKLRSVLFLPDDFVCKKGEVGKEMYIVNYGYIDVIGHDKRVLATLTEGSVFGEISLLSLGGGNRRTADVKSRGFSNLFVLGKNDLQEAIKDYPLAQKALKKKAQKMIKENEAREKAKEPEPVISPVIAGSARPNTPKIVKTVIEVMDRSSKYSRLVSRLTNKSMRSNSNDNEENDDMANIPLSTPASSMSLRESYLSMVSIDTPNDLLQRSTDISSLFNFPDVNESLLTVPSPVMPNYRDKKEQVADTVVGPEVTNMEDSQARSLNTHKKKSNTYLKKSNKISPSNPEVKK